VGGENGSRLPVSAGQPNFNGVLFENSGWYKPARFLAWGIMMENQVVSIHEAMEKGISSTSRRVGDQPRSTRSKGTCLFLSSFAKLQGKTENHEVIYHFQPKFSLESIPSTPRTA
jgi:hypothetical protein